MQIINQRTELVPIDSVRPHERNVNQGDLGAIAESLGVHGFYGTIVAQESSGRVLAGNHRLIAMRQAGAKEIPVTFVDVDDETALRILLVDNRTTRQGYDDSNALAALLKELAATPASLAGTGYDGDALDELLADLGQMQQPEFARDPDVVPEVPTEPVTKPGDLLIMGRHRVLCGDCRDPDVVARLLAAQSISIVVTSPPYAERRTYDERSGFVAVPPEQYVVWYEAVAANIAAHMAADGSYFLNIKPSVTSDGLDTETYVLDLVLAHVRQWGWHWATEFCWERNGVPKSVTRRFKNQFEPIYQFALGEWKMRPDAVRHWSENVPIAAGPGVGDTGWADAQGGNGPIFGAARKRPKGTTALLSEVQGVAHDAGEWIAPGMAYPGNRLPTFAGTHTATGHTAAFPVGLPAFFIQAYTDAGDTVYDPFMGSGSTLIAAEQLDRVAYGCEISPAYCDVIVQRCKTSPVSRSNASRYRAMRESRSRSSARRALASWSGRPRRGRRGRAA